MVTKTTVNEESGCEEDNSNNLVNKQSGEGSEDTQNSSSSSAVVHSIVVHPQSQKPESELESLKHVGQG